MREEMRMILKLVAAILALCAAVCCIIAFWDNLRDAVDYVRDKLRTGPSRKCEEKVEYIDLHET